MQIRTFDILGAEDSELQRFCENPYVIIHLEKIFFDAKTCAFNVVVYYDVSDEPQSVQTCISLFSSSPSALDEMSEIMNDERNFVSSRNEFCAKGGGPIFFSMTYCRKVDETLLREIELEDEYDEGGVLF